MNSEELKIVLDKHQLWLRDEEGGERANLRSANLSSANLRSADLRYADLSSADLSYANLRSADLSSADLSSANLRSADLRYADLSYANLRSANLSSANLRSADLSSADLSYADLSYAVGNRKEIKTLFCSEEYPITYTADYLQIGCERHEITEWWNFDDKRIIQMDGKTALTFWRKWKEIIKQVIEAEPALLEEKEE